MTVQQMLDDDRPSRKGQRGVREQQREPAGLGGEEGHLPGRGSAAMLGLRACGLMQVNRGRRMKVDCHAAWTVSGRV